jgi:cation:H+ antiporter
LGVAALFVAGLLLMLAAAVLFTNSVEWGAGSLGLGHGVTGSILAAIGTAMPESIVPVVALIAGGAGATQTATGAILGAPFMLATVGLGVTGLVCLISGRRQLHVPGAASRMVLMTFLLSYILLIAGAFVPTPVRYGDAALLAGLYALFVRRSLKANQPSDEESPQLLASRLPLAPSGKRGRLTLGICQFLISLVGLAAASEIFLSALHGIAGVVRLSALVLALLLVPLATELPELVAGSLWVAKGRDLLAFGNVTGAMAFQATVPAIIGLCFTPWALSKVGFLAAGITVVGALIGLALTRDRGVDARILAPAGLGLYAIYVVAVVAGRF